MAYIISGKNLAEKIKAELIEEVSRFSSKPVLAVVLVGENDASKIYVNNKKKMAGEIGIDCQLFHLPAEVTEDELKRLLQALAENLQIHGIMVQLPLPKHISVKDVLSLIPASKDVDGLGAYNTGLLHQNDDRALVAATPQGVLYMLKSTGVDLCGKHAVIIGRSNIVGRPMMSLLLNNDCTVTVVHSRTKNIEQIVAQADIVVAACGQAKIVKKNWVKKGATVIDVGINRLDEKLCGDVDFEDVSEVAEYISPVPGGVGPMTVIMLMKNTCLAYKRQQGK
ncbi:MAG: bifunctional 5,10-methylenetetrahydrofolate dehydrogenase/5,10-methenyltetrahydrofolate cyclohydrolase [Alphaproteobacteria bacterium]